MHSCVLMRSNEKTMKKRFSVWMPCGSKSSERIALSEIKTDTDPHYFHFKNPKIDSIQAIIWIWTVLHILDTVIYFRNICIQLTGTNTIDFWNNLEGQHTYNISLYVRMRKQRLVKILRKEHYHNGTPETLWKSYKFGGIMVIFPLDFLFFFFPLPSIIHPLHHVSAEPAMLLVMNNRKSELFFHQSNALQDA